MNVSAALKNVVLFVLTFNFCSSSDAAAAASFDFYLVDAGKENTDIRPITTGDVIDLSTVDARYLSIRAVIDGAERVRFAWIDEKGIADERVEHVQPYSMNGDMDGDYNPVEYLTTAGNKVVDIAADNDEGDEYARYTLEFVLIGELKPCITYTLVNTDTDKDIARIKSGDTIDLAAVGTSLSIRAELDGTARMEFKWTDENGVDDIKNENVEPFSLGGDWNSNYRPVSYLAVPGTKSVQVTAFNASLAELVVENLFFKVIDPANRFDITLVNMGDDIDAAYLQAFKEAKKRWESIIVGEMPNIGPAGDYGSDDWFWNFFPETNSDPIDDLLIGFAVTPFDGVGGTLGAAGCTAGIGNRCVAGVMFFDIEDFQAKTINDVKVIITHEMGHILGLVSATGECSAGCDPSNPSVLTKYTCNLAKQEYELLNTGTELYLENDGGPARACFHWDESSFRNPKSSEMMTAYFEAHKGQPISSVTVAALDDLGVYTELDYSQADPWPYIPSTRQLQNSNGKPLVLETESDFDLAKLMKDVETQHLFKISA